MLKLIKIILLMIMIPLTVIIFMSPAPAVWMLMTNIAVCVMMFCLLAFSYAIDHGWIKFTGPKITISFREEEEED